VLVGEEWKDLRRIEALLQAGAVVVIAQGAETVRAWLPVALAQGQARDAPHVLVRASDLEIDLTERKARWQGKPLDLTERELDILVALARDLGRVWTFEELLKWVWGTEYYGHLAPVHSAIKRLRPKLARTGVDLIIQSVRGVGFRLTPALLGVGGAR
jgi:DNA-binding response OmpR family regulator